MTNPKLNKKQEIIFPDKTTDIIRELVKKYELEKIEKEMEEKISQTEIPAERGKIFENLPTCQISRTVKEIAESKISSKEFVSVLQKRLEIPQEKAKKLAKDLKEKVLILAQMPSIKKETVYLKKTKELTSESSVPLRRDTYREPIE
ncbi:MAG: hypothetical protein WBC21_02615 [Minisyncoccales bacterium]